MNSWEKIYKTDLMHKAHIVKDFLEDNGIETVIINKRDSSYNNFGNYEIFVLLLKKETATALIDEFISF